VELTLYPGRDGSVLASCGRDVIFWRYSASGELLDTWSGDLTADPEEGYVTTAAVAEHADGDVYIAANVKRNIVSGNEGNQSRVRVMKFDGSKELKWSVSLTEFPGGTDDYAYGIGINDAGVVAVTGLSHYEPDRYSSDSPRNSMFMAVIDADGQVLANTVSDFRAQGEAVVVDPDGNAFVGGRKTYNYLISDWEWAGAWKVTSSGQFDWEWSYEYGNHEERGDWVSDITLDASGNVLIVGRHHTYDEVVVNPPERTFEGFMRRLSPSTGEELEYVQLYYAMSDAVTSTVENGVFVHRFGRTPRAPIVAHDYGTVQIKSLSGEVLWQTSFERAKSLVASGSLLCAANEFIRCWEVPEVEAPVTVEASDPTAGGEPNDDSQDVADAQDLEDGGADSAAPNAIGGSLGSPCEDDEDCAGDLFCLVDSGDGWYGGGAAFGYCTETCTGTSGCSDPDGVCFDDGLGVSLCALGCEYGVRNEGKCLDRPAVSCAQEGSFDVCLPTCGSDADCGDRYCDLALGTCVDAQRGSIPVGEACAAEDAAACEGLCNVSLGVCSGQCTLGEAGCGNSALPRVGELGCFPLASYTVGDGGFCLQACEDDADCDGSGFVCAYIGAEELTPGVSGACYPPL
jgi:hypothetical protein